MSGDDATEPDYDYDETRDYTVWDKSFEDVTSNLEVKRTSSLKTFTVTFVDENGTTVLGTDKVKYGEDATYRGTTPAKASDATYSYTFNGWDRSFTNVTEDITVKAIYRQTLIIPDPDVPEGNVDPTPKPTVKPSEKPTIIVPDNDTPQGGAELPETGTIPVNVFYYAGAMLILLGASILVIKKNKKA